MASIIDNKNKIMLAELRKALKQAEKVDILTAFFYFSGFNALAEDLKDKKIRILVGKSIDPKAINDLNNAIKKNSEETLDTYAVRGYTNLNNSQKKKLYIESFIGMFNKSALSKEFDETDSQKVFKMFLGKLNDGSLEIRLTNGTNHAKAYIFTNKPEYSRFGEQKGIVFMGSSNFTYNGLLGQGEMNEPFSDNAKYDEYMGEFEKLWDGSNVDIHIKEGNSEFVEELKKKLWIFAQPKPYNIFIRILFELYASLDNSEIKNPNEISNGKYANFKYQIDAIKRGIDCINKNNGVIIADVVGLGKSIIASAIAHNLDVHRTIIITPPHLKGQWNEYQQDFGLRGVIVYTSGKVEELHKSHATDPNPILYIIDEAHRYRNELSETYQFLHQLTRSNSQNKVILLTATPYNNRPQDLFALVKLFQTPSRSTINSVDNLGVSFRELIIRYNKLEEDGKRNLTKSIEKKLKELSQELRVLIAPIIVRRSRIDLKEIKEYSEDLKQQDIKLPDVVGPELIEYDLGEIRDLYVSTLERLSEKHFICARYKPSAYLIDPQKFTEEYGELFEEADIQLFQRNLAKFIRRLLVMRFESSKAAFRATLDNILLSYENIKKWWAKGYVPIKKQGSLSDPDATEIEETLNEINRLDNEPIDVDKIKKKAIPFPKNLFRDEFIHDVDNDITLLSEIKKEWFPDEIIGFDPKFGKVKTKIDNLLKEDKKRKIVVFSYFADTAVYVKSLLEKERYRVLLYTGSATDADRDVVRENFDASYEKQKNDYDIIVATDALSEGFNLNRAGVVINYDIPYNPTRVVQRIGRINRINKKMFDEIYIFNFFPTDIGEKNTLIKGISTLKMLLINNIVGSDTKTLTPNETLQSYFKRQYDEADSEAGEKSWDNEFRNIFNLIKHNENLLSEVRQIPERARIVRKNNESCVAISFVKRGDNFLFAKAQQDSDVAEILPAEFVLNLFKASQEENGYECDSDLDKKFAVLRDEILKPYPKIKLDKRKGEAIDKLQQLLLNYATEKDYINDLLEVIRTYDDLSDGELKYLANLTIKKNSLKSIMDDLKQCIPIHYITQIKEKAESVNAQAEVIMFSEDLRNDNN
jgi:superfamily II DNA or RNA helicase/HKD family nuclease